MYRRRNKWNNCLLLTSRVCTYKVLITLKSNLLEAVGDIDWLLKELQVFEEKPLGVKPNLVKELSEKVAGDENTIHSEYKSIVMDSFHWKKKIRRGEESESRKTEKLSENMKNQKTKEQTEVTQDVEVVRKKQKCGVCDHELNSDTDEEGETHAQSGFS
ncbi:hypothetical protein JTB14_025969 [Gonioctena quinquepunctata]|nr:hypothetical protein JTB14_025969 [Gonioctena quinquepunctata]